MSQFRCLLNAFEEASQAAVPSKAHYAEKRKAVLEYVEKLEAARPEALRSEKQLLDAYELILTEMRTHAQGDTLIAEWVRRLDLERDTASQAGVTAVSPLRLFQFDRIRRGQVMAEGIAVHAATLEEATAKAKKMADPEDGEIRLTREPQHCSLPTKE